MITPGYHTPRWEKNQGQTDRCHHLPTGLILADGWDLSVCMLPLCPQSSVYALQETCCLGISSIPSSDHPPSTSLSWVFMWINLQGLEDKGVPEDYGLHSSRQPLSKGLDHHYQNLMGLIFPKAGSCLQHRCWQNLIILLYVHLCICHHLYHACT